MKDEDVKERLVLQHHQVYNSISTKKIPACSKGSHIAIGILPAFYPGNKWLLPFGYLTGYTTAMSIEPIHKPEKPSSSMPSSSENKPSLSAVVLS